MNLEQLIRTGQIVKHPDDSFRWAKKNVLGKKPGTYVTVPPNANVFDSESGRAAQKRSGALLGEEMLKLLGDVPTEE